MLSTEISHKKNKKDLHQAKASDIEGGGDGLLSFTQYFMQINRENDGIKNHAYHIKYHKANSFANL
jgi:hypothetical protein